MRKEVKIVLGDGAIMPEKGSERAAAFDLFTPCDVVINPGRGTINLKFKNALPPYCEGKVEPRSNMSAYGMLGVDYLSTSMDTTGAMTTHYYVRKSRFFGLFSHYEEADPRYKGTMNRYDMDIMSGKVDEDYIGYVHVIYRSNEKKPFVIPAGVAIAQYTIYRVQDAYFVQTKELEKTARGEGGFGSSRRGVKRNGKVADQK